MKITLHVSPGLFGEYEPELGSTTPDVVGEPCKEGSKGRFVLIQRNTNAKAGRMDFNQILVNHTEKGGQININIYVKLNN
jgi:hypothetical protein